MDIIRELIQIFDVSRNEAAISESIYSLEYRKEREELFDCYQKDNFHVQYIIDDYRTGYEQLVRGIIENPNDAAKIKANIQEIVANYTWVMELNHRRLFYTLVDQSPLAIMCLLMNEGTRDYYLPFKRESLDSPIIIDREENKDKTEMYDRICNMVDSSSFFVNLQEHLCTFSGTTDEYWKDLEANVDQNKDGSQGGNDKKFMIISIGQGDYVRSAGMLGEELGLAQVNHKFPILNGIDYKSMNKTHTLVYMEV